MRASVTSELAAGTGRPSRAGRRAGLLGTRLDRTPASPQAVEFGVVEAEQLGQHLPVVLAAVRGHAPGARRRRREAPRRVRDADGAAPTIRHAGDRATLGGPVARGHLAHRADHAHGESRVGQRPLEQPSRSVWPRTQSRTAPYSSSRCARRSASVAKRGSWRRSSRPIAAQYISKVGESRTDGRRS